MNAAKLEKIGKIRGKTEEFGHFLSEIFAQKRPKYCFCPNSMSEIQMSETFDNVRSETKEAPLVGRTTKSVLISSK